MASLTQNHKGAYEITRAINIFNHSFIMKPYSQIKENIKWYLKDKKQLIVCSYCNGYSRAGVREMQRVTAELEKEHGSASHGICPECNEKYWRKNMDN